MKKALNIAALLFVLTALAFGLIGCDGNADQAKADEMLGTNVKLNGTWKSQTVTYIHDGKQYSGQIELRFNDDQMQIVAPYGTSIAHRYTRTGDTLTITDPYLSEDNPDRHIPVTLEFGRGLSVDLGGLTFMEGFSNIKVEFTLVSDNATIEDPETIQVDELFIQGKKIIGVTERGKTLEAIVIPGYITEIGEEAFSYCYNLKSLDIPNGVNTIGNSAFKKCNKLSSITIPTSVKHIGNFVFEGCDGLDSITVSEGNSAYVSSDNVLFSKDLESLIVCSRKKTGEYYIPESVSSIYDDAFAGCNGLTSVTIPEGVTEIGAWAFYDCTALTSVTIPASVTSIKSYAFYNCTGLTSVTISEGVTSIGHSAFLCCNGLTSVTIPDSVTKIGYITITMPDGIKKSVNGAFDNCRNLKSIIYTGTIEQWSALNYDVTYENNSYADITCSDGKVIFRIQKEFNKDETVSIVLKGLTPYGKKLSEISIPDGITIIGQSAFRDCKNLTTVLLPESVKVIRYSAFDGCRSLTSITIPDGVTSIMGSAFENCIGLTSITIPASVEDIGYFAFSRCNNLDSITVSAENPSYISIDNVLFTKNLETLMFCSGNKTGNYSIPESVKRIYGGAFYGCTKLTSITIPNSVEDICDSAFDGCTGLTSITIPEGVTTIGDFAFDDCTGLTSVSIPNTVSYIGDWAFEDCTGLTDIYVNQPESRLLNKADVPSGCTIHWNSTGAESV